MTFSYLPKVVHWVFLVFTLFILLFSLKASFLIFLLYTLVVFLFRKRKIYYKDDQITTSGLVFSPVTGKIVDIDEKEEKLNIKLKCFPWNEMGIHMPLTGEVKDVSREKGPVDLASNFPGRVAKVSLEGKDKDLIELSFGKSMFGGRPQLMVAPGDRGRRQVNIGFMPLGGTVELRLPKNCDLMVKVGDDLKAAESVVVGLKRK